MNYAEGERIKIWGRARVVEPDGELLAQLVDPAYRAPIEQAIVFNVVAWDANCSQHIPRLIHAEAVEAEMRLLRDRIATLESSLLEAGLGLPAI
jgi:hypothetical protein